MREPGTESEYLRRYRRLLSRFLAETGGVLDDDPERARFIEWLQALRPSLRAASWRQYRAACAYGLRVDGFPAASERLSAIGTEACKPPPRKRDPSENPISGSERKYKQLPQRAYRRLLEYLSARPGVWNHVVAVWLEAGRLTGLRPCEWRHAVLQERAGAPPRLIVKNAKATHGRAHGETRTLVLSGLAETEMALIRRHLRNVRCHLEDWETFYQAVRKALAAANRNLWPKPNSRRITLYSCRHQFIADAKRAGLSPLEIAAIAGHAVPETAQTHYGKRKAGWRRGRRGGFRVAASPEEINRVRVQKRNNPQKTGFSANTGTGAAGK